MRRTTQTRIKRITAGVMTALLVLQMTPVAPFASIINAFAAPGDEGSDVAAFTPQDSANGFYTSGWLNNHRAAGDDATFTQNISIDAIAAAVDEGSLAKPEVSESDLQRDAEAAADKAVQDTANGSAQELADQLELSNPSYAGEARAAAKRRAIEQLEGYIDAGAGAENPLTDAIKAALEAQGLEANEVTVPDVLEALEDAGLDSGVVQLGSVAYRAINARAIDPLATDVMPNVDLITWKEAPTLSSAENLTIRSTNENVVKDVTGDTSKAERTLEVSSAGSADLQVPFAYQWGIAGFSYSYAYSFSSYSYDPEYTFGDATTPTKYSLTVDYYPSVSEEEAPQQLDINVSLGSVTGTLGSQQVNEIVTGTGTEVTSEVSFEPDLMTDTFDYAFTATDIFNDDVAMVPAAGVTAPEMTFSGDPKPVTIATASVFTQGAFNNPALALQVLAGSTFDAGDAKHYTVSYNNADGTLTLTPKSATGKIGDNDGETSTVTWTLPDDKKVELNVTGIVNPCDLNNIALDTQDFRLEADQQAVVLADANAKIKGAAAAQGEDIASDYYSGVSFESYPAEGQGAAVNVTFTKAEGADEAYADFNITDPSTVTINAMESSSWDDMPGVTLSGTTGTDNHEATLENTTEAKETWLRGTPTATWAEHELAFGSAQVPTDTSAFSSSPITLNAGDGKHEVNLYTKDSKGVVSQITGVTYQVDTLAPSLQSYEVGNRYTVQNNIFFARDQFDVELSVVDRAQGGATGEAGVAGVKTTASGVKTDAIKASYHDDEADADHNDVAAAHQQDSIYRFTVSGDQDIATDSIKVYMEDVAGNNQTVNANDADTIPMEYVRLVSDASAPAISTSWDTTAAANGRYYNTNRTLTLTIDEPFFEYVRKYRNDQVVTTISHDDYVVAVHPSDFQQVGENAWQYSYSFTVDADWTVSNPQITDIVDRTATSTGDSFTIDKTAPTLDVTFNATTDNGYYNAARVATITVTEHNFDPSLVTINTTVAPGNGSEATPAQVGGWTSSGDVHTATVTFPGQGVYTMSIEGTDLALNALPSYSCPEFTVDTIAPEITLSGDVAAHADTRYAYAGDAGLGVAVHDTNIDGTRTTINVEKLSTPSDVNPYQANQTQTATDITKSFQNPSDITRDNDGVYRLTVQAVDLAGNTTDQSVLWSVNRYGSTYVISADSEGLLNTFTNADDLVDIQVTEINVDTLDEDQTAVELSRDTTSSTLARDDDYTVDHGQNETTGWQEYVYTVDQASYASDGAYRLLFHSQDSAANVSENTMPGTLAGGDADDTAEIAFGVDSTAPVVSFVGTLDADTYQQASVPVTVAIEDNLALDHAQIYVNDEVVREISSEELSAASNSFDFEVSESGERQSVRVVAYDVAGNETSEERTGLLINSNPLIQLINNTPLLIGCVVVVAAAVGGGIYLVGKRKKDEEK